MASHKKSYEVDLDYWTSPSALNPDRPFTPHRPRQIEAGCGVCGASAVDGLQGPLDLPCTSCEGAAYNACTTCNEAGLVDEAWGDKPGYTQCGYCDEGENPCERCDESGEVQEECAYCYGDGESECPECDGSGEDEDDVDEDGDPELCNHCSGGGRITCQECGGDGSNTETCPDCQGDGRIPCEEGCEEGWVRCDDCEHEEEGWIPCDSCYGSGIGRTAVSQQEWCAEWKNWYEYGTLPEENPLYSHPFNWPTYETQRLFGDQPCLYDQGDLSLPEAPEPPPIEPPQNLLQAPEQPTEAPQQQLLAKTGMAMHPAARFILPDSHKEELANRPPPTPIKSDDYYYHYAPTSERSRIQTHGLVPADPKVTRPDSTQPVGVYAAPTLNAVEDAKWLLPNRGDQHDLWQIPADQVPDFQTEQSGQWGYITHPVQPEMHTPYESTLDKWAKTAAWGDENFDWIWKRDTPADMEWNEFYDPEAKMPDAYYHIAPTKDRGRIQQYGLIPSDPHSHGNYPESEIGGLRQPVAVYVYDPTLGDNLEDEEGNPVPTHNSPVDWARQNPETFVSGQQDIWRIPTSQLSEVPDMDPAVWGARILRQPVDAELVTRHEDYLNKWASSITTCPVCGSIDSIEVEGDTVCFDCAKAYRDGQGVDVPNGLLSQIREMKNEQDMRPPEPTSSIDKHGFDINKVGNNKEVWAYRKEADAPSFWQEEDPNQMVMAGCPYCGNTDLEPEFEGGRVTVQCHECGAEISDEPTEVWANGGTEMRPGTPGAVGDIVRMQGNPYVDYESELGKDDYFSDYRSGEQQYPDWNKIDNLIYHAIKAGEQGELGSAAESISERAYEEISDWVYTYSELPPNPENMEGWDPEEHDGQTQAEAYTAWEAEVDSLFDVYSSDHPKHQIAQRIFEALRENEERIAKVSADAKSSQVHQRRGRVDC
jgi:hypothetical protein